jgi:FtsP/CotA-like multicopper oxidase with cupredoxin domain
MLPPGFPETTVWGCGSVDRPGTAAQGGTFNSPAFTIEAEAGRPMAVKWVNDLKDSQPTSCENGDAERFGPERALLGTLDAAGFPVPQMWGDAVSERPELGATEMWEIYNFTADAHPIHIHLVQFEVLDRHRLVSGENGQSEAPARLAGDPRPPEPWETGRKDTVVVYPGEVTRVKAVFDVEGLFVWHCHILEHEDNEMMRPLRIGPGAGE